MCLGGCRAAGCVQVFVSLKGVFGWLWGSKVCSGGCGDARCVQVVVSLQGVFRWLW